MWHTMALAVVLAGFGSAALGAEILVANDATRQFRFGTFVGTVTDAQGFRVAGADVLLTHQGNGLKRAAVTGADGTYTVVNIQPGTYEIRISFGSARFERRGVTIRAGDIARVDTQLNVSVGSGLKSPVGLDTREVRVGLHTYGADGRPNASASLSEHDDFTGYVSADGPLCALSASEKPRENPSPGVGWVISSRVLGRTPDAITVRIEWQRLWDNGVRQQKPRTGTLEASIRAGERFPLDRVTAAASECSAAWGSLEASVASGPAAANRGGGLRSPNRGATSAEAAQELRLRSPNSYEEMARLAPGAFQVELWLVQTRPDNTEQVQLITQPLGASTSFVFPPVRVASGSDATDVEVFGFLRRTQEGASGGTLSLQVAVARNLRQQEAPGRPIESYHASGKTVPWPAPSEVLSFELPVSASDERVLGGHRFDLRLRITPR